MSIGQRVTEAVMAAALLTLIIAGAASTDRGQFPWGVPVALGAALVAIVAMLVSERLSVESVERRASARAAGLAERAES